MGAAAEQLHAALGDLLSDVDRVVLTGEYAKHLSATDWLADHVSGARGRVRPSDDHLLLALGAYGEVLDDLLESADR